MRHAMQLHDRRSRIGNSNGLLVPPARRQRLARSAYGAPSPPRPSGPIARRSAARLWLELDVRLRNGEDSASGVPWGEDLGKGEGHNFKWDCKRSEG